MTELWRLLARGSSGPDWLFWNSGWLVGVVGFLFISCLDQRVKRGGEQLQQTNRKLNAAVHTVPELDKRHL
jgi:hypothetical protein